nr:MAG TPA: hypothetical protein [Caudoviricetes sp.]
MELVVSLPIPTLAILIFKPALASFFPETTTLRLKSTFLTIFPSSVMEYISPLLENLEGQTIAPLLHFSLLISITASVISPITSLINSFISMILYNNV